MSDEDTLARRILALLVLVFVAAAIAAAASGCGTSAIGMQTRIAHATAIVTDSAGDAIDEARDAALDRVEAAHPTRGPERDAALDAEAERWRPVGQALDAIREALLMWVAALEAARVLGNDGDGALWPQVLALASRVATLYGRVAALARELGADGVPQLPPGLGSFLAPTSASSTGGAR